MVEQEPYVLLQKPPPIVDVVPLPILQKPPPIVEFEHIAALR